MDSIAPALAATQANPRNAFGMSVMKMAVQNDQQMAAMLSQLAQAGQVQASNPPHLGQSLDTYA